jgi:hypothetical protein
MRDKAKQMIAIKRYQKTEKGKAANARACKNYRLKHPDRIKAIELKRSQDEARKERRRQQAKEKRAKQKFERERYLKHCIEIHTDLYLSFQSVGLLQEEYKENVVLWVLVELERYTSVFPKTKAFELNLPTRMHIAEQVQRRVNLKAFL